MKSYHPGAQLNCRNKFFALEVIDRSDRSVDRSCKLNALEKRVRSAVVRFVGLIVYFDVTPFYKKAVGFISPNRAGNVPSNSLVDFPDGRRTAIDRAARWWRPLRIG